MTTEQIRAVMAKKPFQPFSLKLADGSRVRVKSPEFMYVFPSGRTILVATGQEAHEIIDVLMVTSIEVGNGHAKLRRR